MFIFPVAYEESEHSVTVKDSVPLTFEHAVNPIQAFRNTDDRHTNRLAGLRGMVPLAPTLAWSRPAEDRFGQ